MSHEMASLEGWRWLQGMRSVVQTRLPALRGEGLRVLEVDDFGALVYSEDTGRVDWVALTVLAVPDLDDPATLGCLLAMGYPPPRRW